MCAWGPVAGPQAEPRPDAPDSASQQPEAAAPHDGLNKWATPEQQAAAERGEAAKRMLGLAMLLVLGVAAYAALRVGLFLWPFRYAILGTLAVAEGCFFVLWYRRRYAQLNEQPRVHAPEHVDSMRLFNRFVSLVYSLPEGVDIEMYVSTWFR